MRIREVKGSFPVTTSRLSETRLEKETYYELRFTAEGITGKRQKIQ